MGSDVSLAEYSSNQLCVKTGTTGYLLPSAAPLAAALFRWELGVLPSGALTDTFLYGSLNRVQFLGGQVQLQSDTFNFNSEPGRPFRNFMTEIQHQTLGEGKPGFNFKTIFVGPTKIS